MNSTLADFPKWYIKLALSSYLIAIPFFIAPIHANERSLYQNALGNYDALLKIAVSAEGVNYDLIKKNQHALEHYLYALSVVNSNILQKDEQLALYINAYNAFTIRLILDYWPYIRSIKYIPEYPVPRRFKDKRWKLSGQLVSLNDIEHKLIEPLQNPLAYMALVCATRSCPDLKAGVYDGLLLKKQLIEAAKNFLANTKALQWRVETSLLGSDRPVIYVSEIFRWKKNAIKFGGYTILSFLEEFAPIEAKKFIDQHRDSITLIYLDYDWELNASKH